MVSVCFLNARKKVANKDTSSCTSTPNEIVGCLLIKATECDHGAVE